MVEANGLSFSLRWHIAALFTLAVLVVTSVATAYGIWQGTTDIRESLVDRQQALGSGAANGIQDYLQSTGESLGRAAARIPAYALRPDVNESRIAAAVDPLVATGLEFEAVLLVDSQGLAVASRPPLPPYVGRHYGGLGAFDQARAASQSALSLSRSDGAPFWTVAVPSTRSDSDPYFLVGVLRVPRIQNILLSNVETNVDGALLDEDGQVIAATHPDLEEDDFGRSSSWPRLSSGEALAVEDRPPHGGGEALITLSPLDGVKAHVALLSPRTQIVVLQGQLVRNAVVTSVGLAAIAIVLGVVAAGSISRPVDEIRRAAQRMSTGDLTVRANPRGAKELQELARDFNSMASALGREWEERVRLQDRLEELVKARTAEVERKREEMELFFYGVSHDLKSPVIAISSYAQLAEEAADGSTRGNRELRDYVKRIRRSSQNLQSLVGQLLEFARAERAAPQWQLVDTSPTIRSVVDELRPVARRHGIRLDASGERFSLETDAQRLRAIATNLVQNAIKYMPQRKDAGVRVSWERAADGFVLRVSDNGLGIPKHVQARLFQPFFRHAPEGINASGTGLGLSIVDRLVHSLGGRIELESEVGRGSTFTVRLPLARPTKERVAA